MASVSATAPNTLITYYLHMTDPSQFVPAFTENTDKLILMPMMQADVRFYKFLYSAVGEALRWRDRIIMPESDLEALLTLPGTSVEVLYADGVPAGYFELVKQGDDTELSYFGLRPQFHGLGYGKYLLSSAIARAWGDGAKRVWVHTCNLDAPSAIPNYQKRGFVLYDTHEEPMPERYL